MRMHTKAEDARYNSVRLTMVDINLANKTNNVATSFLVFRFALSHLIVSVMCQYVLRDFINFIEWIRDKVVFQRYLDFI